MKKTRISLTIIGLLLLASCSKRLTAIQNKTPEQIGTAYTIHKDVSYGSDVE
ncbi:hypothetical protein [Sediminicola arcticus]|jgi:hypothetical protein|uniref:Lipoprotein n=1 Tax=Sediminicola arcticus TaxID=1574308 RepID=A0ABV2SXB2_9FLAO|tara:strand:- start:163 stop:318 length:156 start_codon:yes stop_codon:yes gene_type:complete